jgi:hypothetical protein
MDLSMLLIEYYSDSLTFQRATPRDPMTVASISACG